MTYINPALNYIALQTTMGQIPEFSSVPKFGFNPTVLALSTPATIWEGGGVYTYDADSTAPIVSLASDNVADTQNISVWGLDINGTEVIQILTLTGTTRVALTTALWRVLGMHNDGTTNIVGNVFCYTGTGTVPTIGDPEVRAVIIDGNNQTQMATYTIPAGKVGFIHRGEVGIQWAAATPLTSEYARFCYLSREFGKVFRIAKTVSLATAGSSAYSDVRSFPDVIPAKTDIRLEVKEVSVNMGVWGTFDFLIVDQEYFPTEFLTAIGQPS
jgi:hypothetical protein